MDTSSEKPGLLAAFQQLTLSEFKQQPNYIEPELQQKATARLFHVLKYVPAPLNDMTKFLKAYSGVMAGSFLLSCLVHDRFVPGDIDIFFSAKFESIICTLLTRFGWEYVKCDKLKTNVGYLLIAGIASQYHMKKSGCLVNCIFYELPSEDHMTEVICQRIDDGFDLDGCTLKWDGESWRLANDVSVQNLLKGILVFRESCLRQFDDIKDRNVQYLHPKTCNFTSWEEVLYRRIDSRLTKYQDRGFTIANAVRVYQLLVELLLKNHKQPKKLVEN